MDFGPCPATAALRERRRCRCLVRLLLPPPLLLLLLLLLMLLLHPIMMTVLAFTSAGIARDGSKGGARRVQRGDMATDDGGGMNAKAAASFMRVVVDLRM